MLGLKWLTGLRAPLNSEQRGMANSHQRPKSKWCDRATRQEIDEIKAIDQLMAELRDRRKKLINRTNMRTQVWVDRHRRSAQHASARARPNLFSRNRRRTISPSKP